MLSLKSLAAVSFFKDPQHAHFLSYRPQNPSNFLLLPPKSLKSPLSPLRYQFSSDAAVEKERERDDGVREDDKRWRVEEEEEKGEEEDEKAINGIHVPRQKYISISKAELLDAILTLFESKEDVDEFVRLSVCLDSVLHAEHKGMLEKMRIYYSHSKEAASGSVRQEEATSNGQQLATKDQHLATDNSDGIGNKDESFIKKGGDEESSYFNNSLDLRKLFRTFTDVASSSAAVKSRVAMTTDFQHSFMELLHNAQFEELSAQDLMLTYALNNDYLLTLPVYVDWKKASESNAIIFRRGYATERQRGLLLVDKLDYLQSKLLQKIFFSLSQPLKTIGNWLNKALRSSSNVKELENWIEKAKLWLKEQYSIEKIISSSGNRSGNQMKQDKIDGDLPIWLAAQRAIPRYEGFLSSTGPRGRLIRKFLSQIGILPSVSEVSVKVDTDSAFLETYLRPDFLPRITLSDIWKPASMESCGNNVWKILKTSISVLFSQSTLQEPSFQELILLYNEETSQNATKDRMGVLPLQLKIYENIPIPDLSVVFPHKKLSFRILDSVRLDVASILGFSAYFVNYKFENIASSPSAFVLDVIATTALVLYVSRVVLGYKQTWDRYQLLVNRTLYEKTLASGFGSVHFLLDASEQQQYKEAILAFALLLHSGKHQVSCRRGIGDACERFMYKKFNKKIEMPIDKAIKTLMRLDLVYEFDLGENSKLKAVPCSRAHVTLKQRWDSLLSQES